MKSHGNKIFPNFISDGVIGWVISDNHIGMKQPHCSTHLASIVAQAQYMQAMNFFSCCQAKHHHWKLLLPLSIMPNCFSLANSKIRFALSLNPELVLPQPRNKYKLWCERKNFESPYDNLKNWHKIYTHVPQLDWDKRRWIEMSYILLFCFGTREMHILDNHFLGNW